jgi:hypothetical protein
LGFPAGCNDRSFFVLSTLLQCLVCFLYFQLLQCSVFFGLSSLLQCYDCFKAVVCDFLAYCNADISWELSTLLENIVYSSGFHFQLSTFNPLALLQCYSASIL